MADPVPSSGDLPPQNRERQGSMSLGTTTPKASENGGAPPANGNAPVKTASSDMTGNKTNTSIPVPKEVQEVLNSEIGIATLLNRLKQSISSAKEFASFLKKRSALERTHAEGLKGVCRSTQEAMRKPEHRGGTFAQAYEEMLYIHERIADNGIQFAMSLQQMHEDLLELAAIAERNRKGWKAQGLSAEQRVAEIEQAMRKSKAKYDALAEEYDRARTGDPRQTNKISLFKGPKSAAQHEEDLLRKVQGADQDYHGRVQALQSERSELLSTSRPEAVKALQDCVKETDAGVAFQMQKFASFNEKLLLSNGLNISPIKAPEGAPQARGLRDAVLGINNEKDVSDFIMAHHSKLPPNQGEPKYERNPVLNPQAPFMNTQQNLSTPQMSAPSGQYSAQQGPPAQHLSMTGRTNTGGFGPGAPGQVPVMPGAMPQRPSSQQHNRSFSQGVPMSQPPSGGPLSQNPMRNSAITMPTNRFNNSSISSQGPPQLGALPFQISQQQPQGQSPPQPQSQGFQPQSQGFQPQSQGFQPQGQGFQPQGQGFQPPHQRQQSQGINPLQSHPPNAPAMGAQPLMSPPPAQNRSPPPGPSIAPTKPVFGLSLARLYERDGLAVPMVVYQCIQAVDLFGLGVEGIYRQSGSMSHIQKLKTMFDTDSSNPLLDFRNPENFFHDVNGVTGLLKQFFRDLPDPLLTMEHYAGFIEAAKHEDDIVRRDSLHAIINSLPDPSYATLRALTLHLHRVMSNSHINRMNSHNLAVIFGPTLMGTDPSTSISDAGWQIKVVDTILQNTYQIFDED